MKWEEIVTPEEDKTEKEETRDKEVEISQEDHTKTEILKMMNSVYSFIKFTIESESDFPEEDYHLPTLDTKMKLNEDNLVSYRFFDIMIKKGNR